MSQATTVAGHLRSNKSLTSVEAFGLYGISRLAAVILKLKQKGYPIVTHMKQGVHGRYATYAFKGRTLAA